MDNSFEKILFLTSFCCMACDGEIATEELELLKSFSEKEHLFDSLNINEEFNNCLTVLKEIGDNFISSYFKAIGTAALSEDEKIIIINVAIKTIYADNKVEYSEIKFFKAMVSVLNIAKSIVLDKVQNIEEYWLEDDFSDSLDYKFLDNKDLIIGATDDFVIKK